MAEAQPPSTAALATSLASATSQGGGGCALQYCWRRNKAGRLAHHLWMVKLIMDASELGGGRLGQFRHRKAADC
jgi:hypothetical protein